MTDTPKDPLQPGSRMGSGAPGAKRPAATIDLQATEIGRSDIGGESETEAAAAGMAAAASGNEAQTASASQAASNSQPEASGAESGQGHGGAHESPPGNIDPPPTAKPKTVAAPARRSAGAGFLSHLLAGTFGAAVAIIGSDYLANNFGISLQPFSASQVDQLSRRMSAMEQDNKDRSAAPAAALVREELDALKVKVEQTAGAAATVGALQTAQKQLEDKTAQIGQALTSQPPGAETAARLAKLEDQFKMMAQSGAAGQGGNPGAMAALIAKVDGMGADLDQHLTEMRKSLQADVDKQSAHFEDRLAEVDKGMAVDTLKATGKSLSDQIVGLKTDSDKLHQDVATVAAGNQALRQDLAALQQTTGDLKGQIAAQAGTFAKSQQLSDVNATAAKLQADMAAIAARDQTREQGASRIMLSLQLDNLKRAVERGAPFEKELAEVKRLAPKELDLAVLDAGAAKGLPTNALLASEFKDLTWAILSADSKPQGEGSLLGELWQGARSVVQVRRKGEVAGDSTEAVLARTEIKLQADDLEGAQNEISKLQGEARKAAEPWIAKLGSRLAVSVALANVNAGLAKLMGGGVTPPVSTSTN